MADQNTVFSGILLNKISGKKSPIPTCWNPKEKSPDGDAQKESFSLAMYSFGKFEHHLKLTAAVAVAEAEAAEAE